MNPDLIPSSQASNSPASEQSQSESASEGTKASRQQPIPPPSEPMQYRAIGLVNGRYQASDEQFTQGTLVTTDDAQLNAVLLGRVISLVRNHIDLAQEHLWVVYPRTGQRTDELHLQIVGVWEPEKLSKESLLATQRPQPEQEPANSEELEASSSEIEDGYFSIRGEVVYQSAANSQLVVKIKQAPRKESEKSKYFKLKLQGVLKTKAVGQFWDLQVKRQADSLVVQQGEAIAALPKPPKPKGKPQPRQGGQFSSGRSNFDTPRPIRKTDSSSTTASRPLPKAPTPKPQKRPKPPQ